MAPGKYKVLVDDNYHYMDESHRYSGGSFDTPEEALEICKKIVDDWLEGSHKPGMAASELSAMYTMFGEDPFIRCKGEALVRFSARTYARNRCEEICAAGSPSDETA